MTNDIKQSIETKIEYEEAHFYERMRLSKNKQGRIFIGPYEFESESSILNKLHLLIYANDFHAIVNKGAGHRWVRALVYQMANAWHMEKYGYLLQFHPNFLQVQDYADNQPTLNDVDRYCIATEATGDPDHSIWVGFSIGDFASYLANEDNYQETNRSHELDPHKLAMALPDNTIFGTSYPLNKQQSKVIKTIFENIHLIDLERLFASILPSYVEAKGSSLKRQLFEKSSGLDELFEMSLIDQEELNDYTSSPSMLSVLPTLKECMSKSFSQGG